MNIYAIYLTSNGFINQLYTGDDPSPYVDPGEGVAIVDASIDDDTHYFPTGVLTVRPYFDTVASWNTTTLGADGVQVITYGSTLPSGTTYEVIPPQGVAVSSGTITDGIFSMKTLVIGSYQLTLRSFPYQDYKATITAIDVENTGVDVLVITQTPLAMQLYDLSSQGIVLKTFTQVGLELNQDLTPDPEATIGYVLNLTTYTETTIDISLENGYNFLLEVTEFTQVTDNLPVNATVNQVELTLATYLQEFPIPDSLESWANIYPDITLQEAADIVLDRNYNQVLYVTNYTQSSQDIILE